MSKTPSDSPGGGTGLVVAGLAVLALYFVAVPAVLPHGFHLEVGSIASPRHGLLTFFMVYGVLGLIAGGLVAKGLARRPGFVDAVKRAVSVGSDRAFVATAVGVALAMGLIARVVVLQGGPLTDDETCYHFAAELLTQGRVYADSPPMKLFFDRTFMINDGRLYSQYFLGWPALLSIGVLLGVPGAVNPMLHALTMPALWFIGRRVAGPVGARALVLLALSSPFLWLGAGTMLSHTACLCALTWTAAAAMRSRDDDAGLGIDAAVGCLFAVAFFIRPTSALGAGLPLLVWWAWGLRQRLSVARIAAFAVPAGGLAALFFAVNALQNGDVLMVAYQRRIAYAAENLHRFVPGPESKAVANFGVEGLGALLANQAAALLRLNFAVLGWPASLLLAFAAGTGRHARLFGGSLLCFFAVHAVISDVGVDSYGPTHYTETVLGWLVLTVIAARRLSKQGATAEERALPVAAALSFALVAALAFTPVRAATAYRLATDIRTPLAAADDLSNAVVFSAPPFTRACASRPGNGFVYYRPNNDPDLTNDVLWVNHLTLERDQQLMTHMFPDRRGYLLTWSEDECSAVAHPLGSLDPAKVPDAYDEALIASDGAADP